MGPAAGERVYVWGTCENREPLNTLAKYVLVLVIAPTALLQERQNSE